MVRPSTGKSTARISRTINNTNRSSERTTKTGVPTRVKDNQRTDMSTRHSSRPGRFGGRSGGHSGDTNRPSNYGQKWTKLDQTVVKNGPSLADQMKSFQPSDLHHIRDAPNAMQEDDTIVSNCGEMLEETQDFGDHSKSSLEQTDSGMLIVEAPPEEFEDFVGWFDQQFCELVTISWQEISCFFNEHTKCTVYPDIGTLLEHNPGEWLNILGPRLYNRYRHFIYDFHLIFKWLDRECATKPGGPWEYSSLLAMRQKYKESVPPLPSAKQLIGQRQVQQAVQQPKPPSYHSRSKMDEILGTAPYVPIPNAQMTTGSYHTTSPNQVDEQGMPYTNDNFDSQTWSRYHNRVDRMQQQSHHVGGSHHSQHSRHSHYSGESYRSQRSSYSDHNVQHGGEHGSRSGDSSSARHMRMTLYKRYEAPAKTRSTFSAKYQWDGTSTSYDPYRKLILSHIFQAGAGYLVRDDFRQSYSTFGGEYLASEEFWSSYGISLKQAQYDRQWLYGILLGSNKDRENRFLLQYDATQDGILTWIEFEKAYRNDGIGEIKKYKLEISLNKVYKENYPGGLHQYMDDFQVAIEQYNVLDKKDPFSDTKAKEKLLMNLVNATAIAHLLQTCRDSKTWSLTQTVTYIKQNSHLVKDFNQTPILRKKDKPRQSAPEIQTSAMLNTTTVVDIPTEQAPQESWNWLGEEEARTLLHTMAEATGYVHVYNVMQSSRPFRDNLHIPTEIWKRLEPEFQTRIREIRTEIHSDKKSAPAHSQSSYTSKAPNPAPNLPPQYPNTNVVKATHVQRNSYDDSDSYDSDSTDDDMFIRCSFHLATVLDDPNDVDNDLTVRAHLEYANAFNINAESSDTSKVYAISDGGADSTVLGRHAQVIHNTGRYATLVGYDPEHTRSNRIPIVSAYVKIRAHNGIPVFLRVNEAVYNKDSPITLLSEYQIRDHGYVIDSVATKHLRAKGEYGTQRLTLNNHVHVPFEDRGGIMGFEILPIDESDYGEDGEPLYDVFTITCERKWTPSRYRGAATSVASTPVRVHTVETTEEHMYYDPTDALLKPAVEDAFASINFSTEYVLEQEDYEYTFAMNEQDHIVTAFLATLSDDELTGKREPKPEYYGYPALPEDTEDPVFDSYAYAVASWHRVMYDQVDPKKIRPYLGFRPLEVVKQTLAHTTQLARMIIRYPMRRHFKCRAPFFRVTRLDEAVATDPMFSNVPSLHHGYLGAQVFLGCTSTRIDVYGFRKHRRFPKIYKDFIREQGAPSMLRRDNARDEQSEEVLDIHRDYVIKDGFSEPYQQNQNPVESKGIKWLKENIQVLLDRTGAPEGAWYFAAKYLSMVHAHCYNQKLGMTPSQKRTGVTPDISALLQFIFWQRVLYLDHEEKWPASKERSGYWVGVADNVGDALTYWIYDDQMKRLVARSVVRPFRQNRRVKWDPRFHTPATQDTARKKGGLDEGDRFPDPSMRDALLQDIEDEYDILEPDPEPHSVDMKLEFDDTAMQNNKQPGEPILRAPNSPINHPSDKGFDLSDGVSVPVSKEPIESSSKLKLWHKPLIIDKSVDTPKITAKAPYKDVKYAIDYVPAEEPIEVELLSKTGKRGVKQESNDNFDPAPRQKVRRSKRLHNTNMTNVKEENRPRMAKKTAVFSVQTKWTPLRPKRFLAIAIAAVGLTVLPTHVMAVPTNEPGSAQWKENYVHDLRPAKSTQSIEELRTYHTTLDRLNQLLSPSIEDDAWEIKEVIKHVARPVNDKGERVTYLKVAYGDGDKAYHRMEVVRNQDPLVAVKYAVLNHLTDREEWKWVRQYVNESPVRQALHTVFRVAVENGRKFKFGVEVPRNPKHALQIDKENGNDGWGISITTELNQLEDYKTFIIVPDGQPIPRGYKRIPYHIVHDVKFDGRLKSRLVAGGHRTPDVPREDVFSSVVSMESVRLGFILANLNGLAVCAGDVGNAFLYGKTREKVYIIAGPEFGPEVCGKRLIIDKALYGLKTSAARFHEHLSVKMRKLDFRPSRADPDLWMRQLKDGTYEYVARFVDDVIAFSRNPMQIMDDLKRHYIMKGVGKPQYYLGGDVVDLGPEWHKEQCYTAFSAETYIKNCLPRMAKMCDKTEFSGAPTPFREDYHAELDTTPLCSPENASKYRSLIGSANWIITLGRFDIAYAVSTLSRYSMAPREGHFKEMERVFGYLKKYSDGRIILDPHVAPIRKIAQFNSGFDWIELYPDAIEDLPPRMPEPSGQLATLTCYVDADHARDKVTTRSVTGIMLLLNNTPIVWISQRQRTTESSTYGSELVAARTAIDLLIEMRYKLRMLGVQLEEQSVLVGDNLSVVTNTTLPSSALKKKHQLCNYNRVREVVAAGFVLFGYIKTTLNVADVLTKPLGGPLFHSLMKQYMFRRPHHIVEASDEPYVAPIDGGVQHNAMQTVPVVA